jgi:hypothetical protein
MTNPNRSSFKKLPPKNFSTNFLKESRRLAIKKIAPPYGLTDKFAPKIPHPKTSVLGNVGINRKIIVKILLVVDRAFDNIIAKIS